MATLMIIDHIVRTQILQQLSARSDVEEKKTEEVTSKDFNHCLKLIHQIRRQPTLWTGAPMSSLRLAPTTTPGCRFGNSLSPSCSKETQPCPFTRGVLLQSFVDPFHQWCLKHTIYQMQVLWPPWDKTAKPDLCSWILPERDYWRAFTESSCRQLLNLWH